MTLSERFISSCLFFCFLLLFVVAISALLLLYLLLLSLLLLIFRDASVAFLPAFQHFVSFESLCIYHCVCACVCMCMCKCCVCVCMCPFVLRRLFISNCSFVFGLCYVYVMYAHILYFYIYVHSTSTVCVCVLYLQSEWCTTNVKYFSLYLCVFSVFPL